MKNSMKPKKQKPKKDLKPKGSKVYFFEMRAKEYFNELKENEPWKL